MSFDYENLIRLNRKADIKDNKKLYLCRPNKDILCVLNGVDINTVSYQTNLKDYDTLSFQMNRYINVYDWYNGKNVFVESNGYEDINVYLLVYLEDIGYFQIQEPEIEFDGDKEFKTINGYSNEKELEDKDLVNFAINTGEEGSLERLVTDSKTDSFTGDGETKEFTLSDKVYALESITIDGEALTGGYNYEDYTLFFSTAPLANSTIEITYSYLSNLDELGFPKEYITFYNPSNPQLSLLDLALEKMPGWSVGHVDNTLATRRFQFETTSENIYSFLTSTVAPVAECIFEFDTINSIINAYDVEFFGEDTSVTVGVRNLINTVNVNCNEDSVYTRFNVRGDDELTVANVNYGDERIFNLDYFLDTKYMPQSLIDKLDEWIAWRDSNREDFINLSKSIADYQEKISELQYRVPSDADYWKQWDSLNEEALRESLRLYEAELTVLRVSVDSDPQYDADGNYIPWVDGQGNVDDAAYMSLLHDLANGYGGYYTYYEIITYIIPNINIALENLHLTPDQRIDYIDVEGQSTSTSESFVGNGTKTSFSVTHTIATLTNILIDNVVIDSDKYTYDGNRITFDEAPSSGASIVVNYSYTTPNWELYGIEELEGELKKYETQMTTLKDYALDWDDLPEEQKQYHPGGEAAYNIQHFQYVVAEQAIGDENTPNTILHQLAIEKAQMQVWKSELEQLQQRYRNIVDFASLEGFSYEDGGETISFSDEDITLIYTLFHDTDYTNNNILTTSIDNTITTLDVQKELYDDATSKLVEVSQPQYSFSISLDNLLRLEEFKGWEADFVNGNYIRVGIRDDYAVKLRVVSMAWNPCDTQPDLTISFSNMITGASGRNDLTYILGENGGASKNSISAGKGNANTSMEYVTELLNVMSKMQLFRSSVNNSLSPDAVAANSSGVSYLVGDYLKYAEINVGNITGDAGDFERLFANYLGADLIVAKLVNAEQAEIEELTTTIFTAGHAEIEEIIADTVSADYLKVDFANIDTAHIETATIWDLYAHSGIIVDSVSEVVSATNYLSAVRIIGDSIEANTIKADKILLKNSDDGLYYSLNTNGATEAGSTATATFTGDGETDTFTLTSEMSSGGITGVTVNGSPTTGYVVEGNSVIFLTPPPDGDVIEIAYTESQTLYNSLNGSVITASSITASKINVSDLTAFNATIAGTVLDGNTDSMHTYGKAAYDSLAPGFYLDSEGQVGIGDNDDYLRFYKDNQDNWKFELSSDNFSIDPSGDVTVTGEINATSGSFGGFEIDSSSIHSTGKDYLFDSTPGIYMSDTGEINIGDGSNYMVFYKDSNDEWHLNLSTDSVTFQNQDLAEVLSEANQINIYVSSSSGDVLRNNTGFTTLNVTVFYKNQSITNQTDLETEFGSNAFLRWYRKDYGDSSYTVVPPTDTHLSNDGFTYTLYASDVNTQVTFELELITD